MSELRVGIRELKAHLSKYLNRVKMGEKVIITKHGRAVAQITSVSQSLEERMKTIVTAGLAQWNGRKLSPYQPAILNKSPYQISDLICDDRNID